jgi:putative transposase
MQWHHAHRLKGFTYIGFHRYFLTFCALNRAVLFTSAPPVDLMLAQISRTSRECSFAVLTYCFMPDHMHLLVEGRSHASDGRDYINRLKQYSSFYFKQAYGVKPWQRYAYDHVLRDDEKTLVVARYILENPLRAGLVQRIEDYPYCGSLEYPLDALLDWIRRE